jgi:L-phenylalanine/L-methionine N-acetyltransferase
MEAFGSASDVQDWFDRNSPDSFDVVATVDDKAIGFAGLFLFQGTQNHVGTISLFIHDEFHGRGIGRLLITSIIAIADILVGLRRIQLTVFCDNERAISLYHKFGFKIEGRHECAARQGDEFVATFTMARIIIGEPVKHTNIEQLCGDLRNLISLLQRSDAPGAARPGNPSQHDTQEHAEEQVQEIS